MLIRRLTLAATVTAAVLANSGSPDAATHGTQSGGTPTHGTSTTVHPDLQQCSGPAHQCGNPKCHTVTVQVCNAGPGRPGAPPSPNRPTSGGTPKGPTPKGGTPSSACHTEKFQTC
jgi:hypothetical protein